MITWGCRLEDRPRLDLRLYKGPFYDIFVVLPDFIVTGLFPALVKTQNVSDTPIWDLLANDHKLLAKITHAALKYRDVLQRPLF